MSRQKEISPTEKIQQLIKLGIGAATLLKYTDLFLKYRDDLDKIPLDQRSFQLCLDLLTMMFEPKNWSAMEKFFAETDEEDQGAVKNETKIDTKDLIDARIKIHEVGKPIEINTHEVRGLSWPISAQIYNVTFPIYFDLMTDVDPHSPRPDIPYYAGIVLPLIDPSATKAPAAKIEAKIRQNLAQEIASLDKAGYALLLEGPQDLVIRSCLWSSTPPTVVQGLDRIMNAFEIMEAVGEKIRKLFPEFSDQVFHYYLG